MTLFLATLLAIDSILHAIIIARFGVKGNEPPLVFAFIYAALALAVGFAVPYALWASLIVVAAGSGALALAFNRIHHDRTTERQILVLNTVILVVLIYALLFR